MKNWKIFTVVLAISLICGGIREEGKACAWSDEDGWHFDFFEQEIAMVNNDLRPFYFTWDRLYTWDWDSDVYKTSDNLGEWKAFFKGKASEQDIRYIVYKSDISELGSIEKKLANSDTYLGPLQRNTLVKYWLKKGKTEVLQYLRFAKNCEPHVNQDWQNYWEISEAIADRNTAAMEKLILEGKQLYKNAISPEIKLRYAFQVVRLAHYSGNDVLTVKSYDSMVATLNLDGICKWWALGHKAGALRNLGRYPESAYCYSQVFEHCPSKRVQAYDSFVIKTDADFNATLALCQNEEEKASLYFLRAIDPNSIAVEEIENIWRVAPKSQKAELLLVRELEKLEREILEKGWTRTPEDLKSPQYGANNVEDLLNFVQKVLRSRNMSNPELWQLAEAYTFFLNGNPDKAAELSSRIIKDGSEKESIITQATIMNWVFRVEALKKLDDQKLDQLFAEWSTLPRLNEETSSNTLDFLEKHALQLYLAADEYPQAWLCINTLSGLQTGWGGKINPQLLLDFYRSPQKSEFEKFILRNSISCKEPEAELLDLIGVHNLNEFDLEASLSAFSEIKDKGVSACSDETISLDIFGTWVSSCVYCGGPGLPENMDRYAIVKRMLELKKKIDANPQNTADEALQLGNALYNSSYYGFGHDVRSYYRSGIQWGEDDPLVSKWAVEYFELAQKHAKDEETRAEATFMLAKALLMGEEINVFNDGWSSYPAYEQALTTLAQESRDTEFYQDVISECSYFRLFVYR